jgi:hypothetical protein
MRLFSVLIVFFLCAPCSAQSAAQYAAQMDRTGVFGHDRNWNGPEVIYQSSGAANEADAMAWWMRSPPHRRLLQSGAITDIACVGRFCVGRGSGGVTAMPRSRFRFRR